MSKCVAASLLAGVVVCAAFSVTSSVWAQDVSPVPVPPEAVKIKVDEQTEPTGDGTRPLPGITVDSPVTSASSSSDQSDNSTGGSGGQSTGTSEAAAEEVTDGVILGGAAISDTGTTMFDARNVMMRTDGGGDANTFMRNLPNVQYQNDTDDDAGLTTYETIDTRPLQLSISGAQTYENNIIMNGVSISNVTGPVEPFPSEDLNDDSDPTPNLNAFYGLHSQTVFVPSDFVGTATIIDSNASAEYGEFQGGVVLYDLARPPTDGYHASVTYRRHTDQMVDFLLATEDGKNPLDRVAPTFTKESLAASVGAPITNEFSFILQASRKTAETERQKDYEYFDQMAHEDSQNIFFRFASELRTEIGRFTFDTSLTDYSQLWTSHGWRDLEMDVQTESSSTQIEYFGALPAFVEPAIGLGGVTLKSRAYYNDSETGNYTNSDRGFARVAMRRENDHGAGWVTTFETDDYQDWCRPEPESVLPVNPSRDLSADVICYEGGYGSKETGQTDVGLQAQLRGNVFLGNFLIGGEARAVEGRRARPTEFVYYTSYKTATGQSDSPASGEFLCPDGDEACTSDQYAYIKTVSPAYDVQQTVTALHGYAELDQTLGWFNVRAGVRVDYEDYFKNTNIAPRLAGSVTPFPGLTVTGGYNRYYIGETLYYALRDQQPYSLAYRRSHDTTTGKVSEDYIPPNVRIYGFKDGDLATPFNDEYTAAIRIRDPLLGGNFRLRYLERYGRDQFASESCGSGCTQMTNDGESFYRSASAEYAKYWRTPSAMFLSAAGFSTGATWSEQSASRSTYVDDDESDVFIYYQGQSYTRESFVAVTGNLDIPIRIGATLTTSWFNDKLWVDLSAGYNLGYEGVYDTGLNRTINGRQHDIYDDRKFGAVLQLDLDARYFITEQAYVNLHVNNLLNTAGNALTTYENPWIMGRSFWVESGLRF